MVAEIGDAGLDPLAGQCLDLGAHRPTGAACRIPRGEQRAAVEAGVDAGPDSDLLRIHQTHGSGIDQADEAGLGDQNKAFRSGADDGREALVGVVPHQALGHGQLGQSRREAAHLRPGIPLAPVVRLEGRRAGGDHEVPAQPLQVVEVLVEQGNGDP